jgi:lipopolysaccharide transport system permease protein
MLAYLKDIWRCRYFWLSLVKIDLRTRYRRSVIGIGWSLLRPIALTIIFCLVFSKLMKRTDIAEYAPYVLAGLVCWEYIQTAMTSGCQSFFAGEAYIRQHPAPIAIYPLRTALSETVHFLMALCVVFALVWFLHGFGNLPALISLVPTFILLFLLVWSLAILAGFANVYFQDTQHLCDIGFRIFFYATPIFYYPSDLGNGRAAKVVSCNPLVPFLELIRQPILYGQFPSPMTFLSATLIVLVVGTAAVLVCGRLQRQLIFHL